MAGGACSGVWASFVGCLLPGSQNESLASRPCFFAIAANSARCASDLERRRLS